VVVRLIFALVTNDVDVQAVQAGAEVGLIMFLLAAGSVFLVLLIRKLLGL